MTPTNCPRCGKLFMKIRNTVCPACEQIDEEKFQELREYIENNPTSTVGQLVEATNISAKRILRYIREGRLVLPEGIKIELSCKQCGVEIYEGDYCEKCSAKMKQSLSQAYGKKDAEKARKGQGMYTRDQIKKTNR